MSVEIIPIFDDNFEIIGQSDYETVHSKGIWHQVVHCWIIDSDSFSIVYQKRNKTKAIYPDMLDVSVAGHCRINESPVEAVCREAFEELGIKIEPHKLLKIGVRRDAFSSKYKINREFQHIFLYKTSITPNNIKIEKNEIQYIVLLKPDDVLKAIEENQNIFGKKILDDLASEIEISCSEFIPSIDNYNIKIPITTGKYLNGEKKIYF